MESHKTLILRGTPRQYVAPGEHLRVTYEEASPPERPTQQEANLDLVDLWAILRRNKWWIIFVGALAHGLCRRTVVLFSVRKGGHGFRRSLRSRLSLHKVPN